MSTRRLLRAFAAFWLVLATFLLITSTATAVEALRDAPTRYHIALLGAIEGLGACLFMVPRLMRTGGAALLATTGVAATLHALRGEFRGDLIVYFVAVSFIVAHGPLSRVQWATALGRNTL